MDIVSYIFEGFSKLKKAKTQLHINTAKCSRVIGRILESEAIIRRLCRKPQELSSCRSGLAAVWLCVKDTLNLALEFNQEDWLPNVIRRELASAEFANINERLFDSIRSLQPHVDVVLKSNLLNASEVEREQQDMEDASSDLKELHKQLAHIEARNNQVALLMHRNDNRHMQEDMEAVRNLLANTEQRLEQEELAKDEHAEVEVFLRDALIPDVESDHVFHETDLLLPAGKTVVGRPALAAKYNRDRRVSRFHFQVRVTPTDRQSHKITVKPIKASKVYIFKVAHFSIMESEVEAPVEVGDVISVCDDHSIQFVVMSRFAMGDEDEANDRELSRPMSGRSEKKEGTTTKKKTEALSPADNADKASREALMALDIESEIESEQIDVGKLLNTGEYCNCYEGLLTREQQKGAEVAVKVFHKDIELTFEQREAVRDEMVMTVQLLHPNVIQTMGASTQRGEPLKIVTEYFPTSRSLLDVLHDTHLDISLVNKLKMIRHIALGMAHLHQPRGSPKVSPRSHPKRVLHMELKSSNVLVNNQFDCKVNDMGLLGFKGEIVAQGKTNRGTGSICPPGQFLWMAPEMFMAHLVGDFQNIAEQSDVYSFSIIMWEIMAREVPFGQAHDEGLVEQLVVEKGIRPKIPLTCPSPIAQLMKLCWSQDPQKRPLFPEIIQRLDAMDIIQLELEEKEKIRLQRLSVQVVSDDFVEQAIAATESGDFDEAKTKFSKAIQDDPSNARAHYYYALFLNRVAKDSDRAGEHFSTAISLDQRNHAILRDYAVFLWKERQDLAGAETFFQRSLHYKPDDQELFGMFLDKEKREHKKATTLYRQVLAVDPDNLDVMVNLASIESNIHKNYSKAEELYQKVLKIDPEYPDGICQYAVFLSDIRRDYKKAEELFKCVIKAHPSHNPSLCHYGLFLRMIRSDTKRALEYLRRAVEVDPRNAMSLYSYASILKANKDFRGAEAMYKRAIEANPNDAIALYNYGAFLAKVKKDMAGAEIYFKQAVKIAPTDSMILNRYGKFLNSKTTHKLCGNNIQFRKGQGKPRSPSTPPPDQLLPKHRSPSPLIKAVQGRNSPTIVPLLGKNGSPAPAGGKKSQGMFPPVHQGSPGARKVMAL